MITLRTARMGIAVVGICMSLSHVSIAQDKAEMKRPVLNEFIAELITDHPVLLSAKARRKATKARADGKSLPVYNPELELGYENAEENTKEIGISQTFDISGKRRSRRAQGRRELAEARTEFDLERKAFLSTVLSALLDYETASTKLDAANRQYELSQKFLTLIQDKYRLGQVPKGELLTAQLALAEVLATRNEAHVQHSEYEQALVKIVGEKRAVWPKLFGEPGQPLWVDVSVETLPEVLLAKQRADTSRESVNVARSERMPDPTVGLTVGDEGRNTTYGLNVSVPLPVRNNYRSGVRSASAEWTAAQQDYFKTKREMRANYVAAYEKFDLISSSWGDWEELGTVPLNEQRELLGRLLEAQEIGALDYLIQLNQTFTAELAAIELRGRLWGSWLEWKNTSNTLDEWLEEIQ